MPIKGLAAAGLFLSAVAACTAGEPRDARDPEPEPEPDALVAAPCVLSDGSTFEILEIRYLDRARLGLAPGSAGTALLRVNGKVQGTGEKCAREDLVVLETRDSAANDVARRIFDIIAEEYPESFSWRSWRDHGIQRLSTREEDRERTQAFLRDEMFPHGALPGKASTSGK